MKLFPELVNELHNLYTELKSDKVELAILKGKKICPNCGTELDAELIHCTNCSINVENVSTTLPTQTQLY